MTESVPASGLAVKAGPANALGAYGERLAARYLIGTGMRILDRNWRCDQGEIDIVAMDDTSLVIVEVKTRRSLAFGSPVEAVTAVKAARLRRLAACWLRDHRTPADAVADSIAGSIADSMADSVADSMADSVADSVAGFVAQDVADIRIDVVGVLRPVRGPAQIEHLVGVAP